METSPFIFSRTTQSHMRIQVCFGGVGHSSGSEVSFWDDYWHPIPPADINLNKIRAKQSNFRDVFLLESYQPSVDVSRNSHNEWKASCCRCSDWQPVAPTYWQASWWPLSDGWSGSLRRNRVCNAGHREGGLSSAALPPAKGFLVLQVLSRCLGPGGGRVHSPGLWGPGVQRSGPSRKLPWAPPLQASRRSFCHCFLTFCRLVLVISCLPSTEVRSIDSYYGNPIFYCQQ